MQALSHPFVIPAQAGVQRAEHKQKELDSCLRGNDKERDDDR
jgi:hypothetical protein